MHNSLDPRPDGFETIGAVLHAMREDLGLTQHQLGCRLGVGKQWVYELEKGNMLPSKEYLNTFLAVYRETSEKPSQEKRARVAVFLAVLKRLHWDKNLAKLQQKVEGFFGDLRLHEVMPTQREER